MIKVNFVAAEIAKKKAVRTKKLYLMIYSLAWIISLFFIVVQYQTQKIEDRFYHQRLKELRTKVEKNLPQFERAVGTFYERNRLAETLREEMKTAASITFVIKSMETLAASIENDVWLTRTVFAPTEIEDGLEESQMDTDTGELPFSMLIQGNVFVNLEQNNKQLNELFKKLKAQPPFNLAKGRLNLSNMRVKKLEERYYHSFIIEFVWSDVIL